MRKIKHIDYFDVLECEAGPSINPTELYEVLRLFADENPIEVITATKYIENK